MPSWPLHPRGLDGAGVTDGDYAVQIASGKVVGWVSAAKVQIRLVPLTTTIGGVPEFVWDADDQLVMTEDPSL